MILNINKLTKYFNGDLLFRDISFSVEDNEKVALIGNNGTGKSTILKIINDLEESDSGVVNINKSKTIGYLSQSVITDENNTLYEEVISVFDDILRLEKQIEKQLELLNNDPTNQDILDKYGELEHKLSSIGGYEYKYKIDTVLTNFNFPKSLYDRKISTFSGGEKTRANFAKLLLIKPDLLILDEPTNHLDIYILEWLENFLVEYDKAILLVSHDKYFINKIATKIVEIESNTATSYKGNFDFYEKKKADDFKKALKDYSKQQKEIEYMQDFVKRFRYKATKAKQAQDRLKKLSRLEIIDKPFIENRKIMLDFKDHSFYSSDAIIKLSDATVGYKDNVLLNNINVLVYPNTKIAIIGANGLGKTTLLKAITQGEYVIDGNFSYNKHIKFGYFDQTQANLTSTKTVFNYVHDLHPLMDNGVVKGNLFRFMFSEEDLIKEVNVLSGGEKVRLNLMLLMLDEPNVLVLDEPTNHLDLTTKQIVEDVISNFKGTVIFVSHDRSFINTISDIILEIKDNNIIEFSGTYDEYKAYKSIPKTKEKSENKKVKTKPKVDIKKVEKQITEVEERIDVLEKSKFDFDVYANSIKFKAVEKEIEELNQKLEELYELV